MSILGIKKPTFYGEYSRICTTRQKRFMRCASSLMRNTLLDNLEECKSPLFYPPLDSFVYLRPASSGALERPAQQIQGLPAGGHPRQSAVASSVLSGDRLASQSDHRGVPGDSSEPVRQRFPSWTAAATSPDPAALAVQPAMDAVKNGQATTSFSSALRKRRRW